MIWHGKSQYIVMYSKEELTKTYLLKTVYSKSFRKLKREEFSSEFYLT